MMEMRWIAAVCAAMLCLALGPAAAAESGGMRIVGTGIAVDAVSNEDGWGSLSRSGEGSLLEGDLTKMPQAALIGPDGESRFPWRETFLSFYRSGGIVSLTESGPYSAWDLYDPSEYPPQYFKLDGAPAFAFDPPPGFSETTEEGGIETTVTVDWQGGPVRDGNVLVRKTIGTEWRGPWSGGADQGYVFQFLDASGVVTHTLPERFSEILGVGALGIGTRYRFGWFGEGLAACTEEQEDEYGDWGTGLLGYMDSRGRMEILLEDRGYTAGYPFSEGLAQVADGQGKRGFIDRSGALVIPCVYDGGTGFHDGLCAVRKDGKWGYIDAGGREVLPFVYDDAPGAGDGLAAVGLDGRYGLMDYEGEIVVPLEYDDITSYEGGAAYGIRDGLLYIFTGYEPVPGTEDSVSAVLEGSRALVSASAAGPARLMAAAYDGAGRMLAVDAWDISAGVTRRSFALPAGTEEIRTFLLDRDALTPLCSAWSGSGRPSGRTRLT